MKRSLVERQLKMLGMVQKKTVQNHLRLLQFIYINFVSVELNEFSLFFIIFSAVFSSFDSTFSSKSIMSFPEGRSRPKTDERARCYMTSQPAPRAESKRIPGYEVEKVHLVE